MFHFFCFPLKTPFSGRIGPKFKICSLGLIFATETNLIIQNSMVMFTFPILEQVVFDKFCANIQNCQLILKFGALTYPNMQNLMVMLNISSFDWNYPFWANLLQKMKNAHLNWKLVPWLIRICRTRWYVLFYLF